MFRHLVIISVFLITFPILAKSDLLGDIIEGVGNAVIEEDLEPECEEPAAGVCKCSPYKEGTGNTDIVTAWDNCKGKITYENNVSLEANFKNGSPTGKKCSAFDANGKEYPGDCSSGEWVEIKKEETNVASNNASKSSSKSPQEEFIKDIVMYYQWNQVFKPCSISGGIRKSQYKAFKKESEQYIKFRQKARGIKSDELKGLKVEANKRAAVEMKQTTSLFPMLGVGQPMNNLGVQQLGRVVKLCSDVWSQSMVFRGLMTQEMNQGSNDPEDLDF